MLTAAVTKLLTIHCSRDAKLLVPAKDIGSLISDVGYIKNVSCNSTGTKVSFIMMKVHYSPLLQCFACFKTILNF